MGYEDLMFGRHQNFNPESFIMCYIHLSRSPDLCSSNLIHLLLGYVIQKWYLNQYSALTVAGTVPDFHGFPCRDQIIKVASNYCFSRL